MTIRKVQSVSPTWKSFPQKNLFLCSWKYWRGKSHLYSWKEKSSLMMTWPTSQQEDLQTITRSRKVRNMMRNKSKLSKAILRSKSAQRFLKLKEKLEEIEVNLKSSGEQPREESYWTNQKEPQGFLQLRKKILKNKFRYWTFLQHGWKSCSGPRSYCGKA